MSLPRRSRRIGIERKDAVGTLSDIPVSLTGEQTVTKDAGGRARPTGDEIARLAHEFYETRGRQDGQDVDDWLAAEQQLTRHYR